MTKKNKGEFSCKTGHSYMYMHNILIHVQMKRKTKESIKR